MACEFEVRFPRQNPLGTEWALEALDLVEPWRASYPYFQPASEIGRINRLAAEEPVEIESPLFEFLLGAAAV